MSYENTVGVRVGLTEGTVLGVAVGNTVGACVGLTEGAVLGVAVGSAVGSGVSPIRR